MSSTERVSIGWRVAGALAGVALVAVFLGCMSLNIGCRDSGCTDSIGVTTDSCGVVRQEGKVTLGPGCSQQVFYPICYASIPNLELRESGCISTHHLLSHQEKNYFVLENKDPSFSRTFRWVARGTREAPVVGPPAPWVVQAPEPALTLPVPKETLPTTPVPVVPNK